MSVPSSLANRIHSAAHRSCCAGSVAGVECDLLAAIVLEIEATSTHVCTYCSATLPVSLSEVENLQAARTHMRTCMKHPVRRLIQLLVKARKLLAPIAAVIITHDSIYRPLLQEIDQAVEPFLEPGEFHAMADVQIPEGS